MEGAMESVEVTILGQRYMVRGEAPRAHILRLAEFLDGRIRAVYKQVPGATPMKASVLAGLILSDELLGLKKDLEATRKRLASMESSAESLLKMID
jgi:cell division protein ZapA (FtsZ GTPase activity inhibitor)